MLYLDDAYNKLCICLFSTQKFKTSYVLLIIVESN